MAPTRSYPRIFLDIELYRPATQRGRAGFFNDRTRLVAVAVGVSESPGETRVEARAGRDEAALLKWLLSRVQPYARQRARSPLVGYGILTLDIPFVILRAQRLLPHRSYIQLREALLRGFTNVDMFQAALLAYAGQGLPSMAGFYSALRAARGLEPRPDKGTGYRVHELYERGDLGSIREYAKREMNQLIEAYNLLVEPGPVYPSRVPDEWKGLARLLPVIEDIGEAVPL